MKLETLDGNKTEHCLVGVKFICQYDVIQIKLLGIWKKKTKNSAEYKD